MSDQSLYPNLRIVPAARAMEHMDLDLQQPVMGHENG
jgi:hypothetical protein